jgi:hypothetical protein
MSGKAIQNIPPFFPLCVLQFCRGLVRLVELSTKAHTLRYSNKKDASIYPPLNKCYLLLLPYAVQNALEGFVLFFYQWYTICSYGVTI